MLLDCIDLQDVRRRHFSVTCLRDLFETVDNRVVDFIKDVRFNSLLLVLLFIFFVAFNWVYDKTVVLRTHFLIIKNLVICLFLYLFKSYCSLIALILSVIFFIYFVTFLT